MTNITSSVAKPRLGLTLSGGAARGAYQVGAWKALTEHGVSENITCFSGASVGGLNAALFSTNRPAEAIDLWLSLNKDDILHFAPEKASELSLKIAKESLKLFSGGNLFWRAFHWFYQLYFNGIFSQEGILKLIRRAKIHKISPSSRKVWITCRRTISFEVRHFLLNELNEKDKELALLGSASIPFVFSPVKINGKFWSDGGVPNINNSNIPIEALTRDSVDRIIYIAFDSSKVLKKKCKNLFPFYPRNAIGELFDFSPKTIENNIAQGYDDTNKLLKSGSKFLESTGEFLKTNAAIMRKSKKVDEVLNSLNDDSIFSVDPVISLFERLSGLNHLE